MYQQYTNMLQTEARRSFIFFSSFSYNGYDLSQTVNQQSVYKTHGRGITKHTVETE